MSSGSFMKKFFLTSVFSLAFMVPQYVNAQEDTAGFDEGATAAQEGGGGETAEPAGEGVGFGEPKKREVAGGPGSSGATKGPGSSGAKKGPGGTEVADEGSEGSKEDKKKKSAGCFGAGNYSSLIFLGLMFAVFYFLLIRPQQKKQKEHQEMLGSLKVGDRVLTTGGILGRITGFSDHYAVLEIQEKVRIKVLRSSLSGKAGTPEKSDNK